MPAPCGPLFPDAPPRPTSAFGAPSARRGPCHRTHAKRCPSGQGAVPQGCAGESFFLLLPPKAQGLQQRRPEAVPRDVGTPGLDAATRASSCRRFSRRLVKIPGIDGTGGHGLRLGRERQDAAAGFGRFCGHGALLREHREAGGVDCSRRHAVAPSPHACACRKAPSPLTRGESARLPEPLRGGSLPMLREEYAKIRSRPARWAAFWGGQVGRH